MVIGIKLSLTAFFVYVLKGGINDISIATIVSQLALLGVAVFYMNAKKMFSAFLEGNFIPKIGSRAYDKTFCSGDR